MMRRAGPMKYGQDDHSQFVELPYADSSLAMVVVVPKEGVLLSRVEAYLEYDDLLEGMNDSPNVDLSLPRFEMAMPTMPMSATLRRLGIASAFIRGTANFSGIVNTEDEAQRPFLSEVYHRTFIHVDETGTEAAAATAVAARYAGAGAPPQVLANRPFLFFIRDTTTGAVLFMGRVADPSAHS